MEQANYKYIEKLARLVYISAIAVIIFLVCRYFSNVLAYIATAAIVSLLARPVMQLLRKVKIRKKSAPEWLLALISILLMILVICGLVAGLMPVITKVVTQISSVSSENGIGMISLYLTNFNDFLKDAFSLRSDFKIEVLVLEKLKSALSVNFFGSMIGSVASAIAGIGIGIFSVVFISFFLIKDDKLISRIVLSFSPNLLEERIGIAMHDIGHLLSRYFVGLIIEMVCVGFIDFIGLWAVARLNFDSALGIGFLAGLLNIIPYLGPVIGGIAGAAMALVLKYCSAVPVGLDVSFWGFVMILALIFCAAQLVDNYVLQPIIYSSSIQANPLEIFIVMLVAGTIGGVLGMLVAIPCYTVVRVIAIRFFPDVKFIRTLVKKD